MAGLCREEASLPFLPSHLMAITTANSTTHLTDVREVQGGEVHPGKLYHRGSMDCRGQVARACAVTR